MIFKTHFFSGGFSEDGGAGSGFDVPTSWTNVILMPSFDAGILIRFCFIDDGRTWDRVGKNAFIVLMP